MYRKGIFLGDAKLSFFLEGGGGEVLDIPNNFFLVNSRCPVKTSHEENMRVPLRLNYFLSRALAALMFDEPEPLNFSVRNKPENSTYPAGNLKTNETCPTQF